MKKSHRLMLAVAVGGGMFLAALTGFAGPANPAKGKLLHFGNMGGLMPSLQQKDLPEPESEAAELVFKMCGQCHNSPAPGLHTVKEWETVFWRMYWRMHLMNAQFDHFMVPTFGEGELMFAYLKKHAMRTISLSRVNMEQPGAKNYTAYCSQCHQLPDPQLHTAADWPKVTSRMGVHMGTMSKNVPTNITLDAINTYLQANAAR